MKTNSRTPCLAIHLHVTVSVNGRCHDYSVRTRAVAVLSRCMIHYHLSKPLTKKESDIRYPQKEFRPINIVTAFRGVVTAFSVSFLIGSGLRPCPRRPNSLSVLRASIQADSPSSALGVAAC